MESSHKVTIMYSHSHIHVYLLLSLQKCMATSQKNVCLNPQIRQQTSYISVSSVISVFDHRKPNINRTPNSDEIFHRTEKPYTEYAKKSVKLVRFGLVFRFSV